MTETKEKNSTMQIIDCCFEDHGETILTMFNHAIMHSTALYEYQPRSLLDIEQWFTNKNQHEFPVIGLIDSDKTLLGFASYGMFRPYPANKFTAELAIYVDEKAQGQGIASHLLPALLAKATSQNIHTLIAAIDENNHASIALHKKFGFFHAGTLKEVGYKFDKWLNLCFYQRMLS